LPGTTAEIYDKVLADTNLGGKVAPGEIFHVAGPYEGGWRVVEVWESQEQFEQFAREQFSPLTRKHGAPNPPNITIWEVHNYLTK
jgi:hypothetical protein